LLEEEGTPKNWSKRRREMVEPLKAIKTNIGKSSNGKKKRG